LNSFFDESFKVILYVLVDYSWHPVTFKIKSKSDERFFPPLVKSGTLLALKKFFENFLKARMELRMRPLLSSIPILSSTGLYPFSSGFPLKNLNSVPIFLNGFLHENLST
jgi:hypothetical protein